MAAKESLDQDITISQVPYTDLKSHISFFISRKWQECWSSCRNKLFQIKPSLCEWPPGCKRSCKEEVVLLRLRIGHTYFSHSYILRREDPPECTACQEIYSVRHVLIDCIDLGLIRPRFYSVPDMKTLFRFQSSDLSDRLPCEDCSPLHVVSNAAAIHTHFHTPSHILIPIC